MSESVGTNQWTKKLLENELYYRSKPIKVLTQIMSFWEMIVYVYVFNRNEPVFGIGQLLGRRKTAKVDFASKPTLSQILKDLKIGRNGT